MISKIVGLFTGNTVEKGLDMVNKGVDAAWFTDEEKSVAAQKILDWKLKWIQATGAQSVARRIIAYGIVGLWMSLVVTGVVLTLLDLKEQGQYVFKVLNDVVHWPFITIIGFYYAAHVVRANK